MYLWGYICLGVHTLADLLFGKKSFSIALGGGFFLFVPFLLFSSLSPFKALEKLQ